MTPTLDRRRALASISGFGLAGLASAGSIRAAAAQDSTRETESAMIVVSATGRASAPATTAIAQLILRSDSWPIPIDVEPAAETPQSDEAPVVTQNELDTIVAELIEQGVDQSGIITTANDSGFASSYFGPGTGVIAFQLNGEAIKSLPKLLDAAKTMAESLGLMFDSPGVMLLADSCEDLRGEAFTDSVTRGREEADLMATALEVELGDLIRAVKQMVSFGPAAYSYTNSDSCDDLISLGTAIRSFLPTWDPTLTNEFTVYAQVELTFAAR